MKKIFTLFLSVMLFSTLIAQEKPLGIIAMVPEGSDAPVIDGQLDEVYTLAEAEVYSIELNFQEELPTLGEPGETNWRAVYTEEGMYLFITVTDESYWPSWIAGDASYLRDKPEVYFDVNYILEDGLGCQSGSAGNQGHYQYAPEMSAENVNGELNVDDAAGGFSYAFMVEEPNYTAEYYFPFEYWVNNEGGPVDLTGDVGFDITICESDEGDPTDPRRRMVWANIGDAVNGAGQESWANMDDCGIINFDGAEPPIYVDEINLSVDGAITEDGQKLQIMVEVLPEDATSKVVKWELTTASGKPATASIDADGWITPSLDEELTIQAISADGFVYSNEIQVSITGQVVTMEKINVIKNGFFDEVDSLGGPGDMWYGANDGTFLVVDGVLEYSQNAVQTNIWDNGVKQWITIPYGRKDENWVFSFKAWADADRTFQCKIEDQANGWATPGVCGDPRTDGTSFWPAASMSITTVPTVYTFNLTWDNLAENANIQFNWQLGDDATKVYLDSIMLVAEADLALLPTSNMEISADEGFKVYPNPVENQLTVEFSRSNVTVAIYNSVGIKMEEEVVFGNRHTFDVSRYPKGMYFVKTDQAVEKFVK